MTKLKWNKYFATTNRRQNILIEHTLREKNFCVKYNRGVKFKTNKKKEDKFCGPKFSRHKCDGPKINGPIF